jgi:thioredoxin reductase (NADPH)
MIKAKSVILAAGAGAFGPNRPPLEGIENYEGKSVHYMVRTREKFADKTLVIAGGGDSAVDWALSLGEIAKKIYIVHRRDKFRAAVDNVSKLRAHHEDPDHPIELVVPYQLRALHGDGAALTHVTVATLKGEERLLRADCLLPFFGIVPDMSNLEKWGLAFNGHQITVDPVHCETSKKGIYAIGDVADYEGKLKLILTGFAEAAQAAHHCYTRSHPNQALHFEYSTSKGVPGAA